MGLFGQPLGGKCLAALARRWISIGIKREEKNRWETRTPLVPADVKDLLTLPDVRVVAQPCTKRIFNDKEYSEAGARISEDLSGCDIIVAVKEIPPAHIVPGKIHVCFSHTHKGQPNGVPILQGFREKCATLVDYELLTDASEQRVLAFGKYAGYVGLINCLHGLGDRLLQLGYRTPFLNIGLAHHYTSLKDARRAVQLVAKEIEKHGLPAELGPLSFVFTGSGNVSTGAREIFALLPHKTVKPKDLEKAVRDGKPDRLISTVLGYEDFTAKGKPDSVFAAKFAPHTSVLVNGLYWDEKLPRILSKDDLAALHGRNGSRMIAIADISCDINGGVECTSRATSIDSPFMYYNAALRSSADSPTGPRDIQLMSVDNLPAQLPRDASEYFSRTLSSILKPMLETKRMPEMMERATIVRDGQLVDRFKGLVASVPATKSVLVLGSGYVAQPAVDYLSKTAKITVASNSLEDARRITLDVPNADATLLEASDRNKLSELVRESDVVISLLPAAMHPAVADVCIERGRSMVTGSYISPKMKVLDQRGRAAGITILNEIGLDPGLDHLSAMKMIDEARSQGDKIESFVSWCGGLPAPECADNPFGYKFSWRPQGVLLATQNPARYLLHGKTVEVAGQDLLRAALPIKIHPAFAFEGIPNRDSMSYIEQYGLHGVRTMFRGTLRYRGFAELMDSCARIGLLSTDAPSDSIAGKRSWLEVMETLVPQRGGTIEACYARALGSPSMLSRARSLINALEWVGALDSSTPFAPGATLMDSFAGLLEGRMKFQPGERDMAFMFHEVQVTSGGGKRSKLTSTLVQYGDPCGYSAMARTVGLPVAIAGELLLNGRVDQKGVIAPLSREIYDPMLRTLAGQGIAFTERSQPL